MANESWERRKGYRPNLVVEVESTSTAATLDLAKVRGEGHGTGGRRTEQKEEERDEVNRACNARTFSRPTSTHGAAVTTGAAATTEAAGATAVAAKGGKGMSKSGIVSSTLSGKLREGRTH